MRHDEAAQNEEKINGKVGSAQDREEIEQACLGQKKNGEMELHHRDSGNATQSVKASNPARVIHAEHL
jgi:hypothetical protein